MSEVFERAATHDKSFGEAALVVLMLYCFIYWLGYPG